MDGGSNRAPRPVQRVVNRTGVQHQQPGQVPTAKVEPQPVHRSFSSPHPGLKEERTFWQRFLLPGIAALILVLVIIGGLIWSSKRNPSTATAIDGSKYQAVFFTNGQVYFGKLHTFNKDHMKLKDIYYLQTQAGTSSSDSENPQRTATDQKNVQLIKLGDEVHGPQDEMIISKDQLLFFENLKPEGKVAQSIDQYKQSNR